MPLTIPAGIKLDRVLRETIKALSPILAPLKAFSRNFDARGIARGSTLNVPFIPLAGLASTNWDAANGYVPTDAAVEKKPILVDKRKYQTLTYSSEDLVDLPESVLIDSFIKRGERLSQDVVGDILSAITAANYGATVLETAASAFDSDDIIDLGTTVANANWPATGRSIVLDTTFTGNVKKDPALKNAAASGSVSTLREGTIGRVGSFDTYEAVALPENAERLKGFVALDYALLLANAPILPSKGIKEVLIDFRTVTDPVTGLTLTFRHFVDPQKDTETQVLECTYGFAKGDPAQLKRITRPA